MDDLKRTVQGDREARTAPDQTPADPHDGGRTAGTDRDLDESGESQNQGHGHARHGGRGSGEAGRSERVVTDRDREERDLGGPGGP
jgi:hypothetical protein